MKIFAIIALVVASLAAVGYFLTTGAGKPIASDLSVIGQGKPAFVLAYENYSPSGGEALNLLRKVRGDFDSRLEFVVADLGTPQGRTFAERYQLLNAQAVFLKQDGEPLQATGISEDEQGLRDFLESALVAVE